MDPQHWHDRWTNNQIGFHQESVNAHLSELWPNAMQACGKVFAPLCGKSVDLLWLRDQGYQVVGIELSPIAVRDFFAENQLTATQSMRDGLECWSTDGIEIYVGDFFHLTSAHLSDVTAVFDRASLIALPPDMRKDYAKHIQSLCVFKETFLITLEYPQDEMQGPPFSVPPSEVNALYADNYTINVLKTFDALAENQNFVKRGVSQLNETVYHLVPKS